jgi:hypothetical protein
MKILSFDVGIINLAYCIFDTNSCKIDYWGIIDLKVKDFSGTVPSGNAAIAKSANDIHITLITELDHREYLKSVDYVVIEKQPSFNPKMRIIGGCLQSYFYIRGIVDSVDKIKSVEFFSPKHKLKCYTGPALTIESKSKNRYTQTKKMGILIAQQKLQEFDETETFKTQFATSRKQDDLADCYLQAITFSLFRKFITNTTTPIFVEQVPKMLTKTEIKRRLQQYLDQKETTPTNFLEVLNGMDSPLKNSIFTKWNIQNFEGDLTFFDELSMKRYKLPFQRN